MMMRFPAPYVSWEVIRIELRLTSGAGAIVVVLSTFMMALPAALMYARRCERAVVWLTYVTFPGGIVECVGQYMRVLLQSMVEEVAHPMLCYRRCRKSPIGQKMCFLSIRGRGSIPLGLGVGVGGGK